MGGPNGWQRFIQETSRSPEGRAAFQAYREQKRLALAAPAKLQLLEELLDAARRRPRADLHRRQRHGLPDRPPVPGPGDHAPDEDEGTASTILERFHSGEYSVVVTSQVLNEGVDVPAANVGIVLSGTGSVPRARPAARPRLLRKHGDKQAVLYEVVARGTAEEFTSDRRRQHHAFQ